MSKSRLEKFLYALYSLDFSDLPTPLSRIEELYKCLVTGDEAPTFEPLSRVEKYLMAILGAYDVELLPNPLSRVEVLLHKLATGNDNLDDVKTFLSEHEELLAEIIRNGGAGGNIDIEYVLYTLSTGYDTLYNTAKKPVKSAILKGQTLVNIIDKPCSVVTTIDKNRTREFTLKYIKTNTDYFVIYDITTDAPTITIGFLNTPSSWSNKVDSATVYKGVLKLNSGANPNYFRFIGKQNATTSLVVNSIMVIEYQEGMENWDIPYFEGMQSVKMPVLTTTGKNLFDGKLEMGFLLDSTGQLNASEKHKYTPSFIKIDASKKYCLHAEADSFIGVVNVYYYDDNKNYLGFGKDIITGINTNISKLFTPHYSDASYVRFRFFKPDNVELSIDSKNIAFYESSTIIDMYKPYKSNILTVNEEVELRGIGEVQDELDLTTGKLIQRIGEVVLDGSENIVYDNGYERFYTELHTLKKETNYTSSLLSDKFKVVQNQGSVMGGDFVITGYNDTSERYPDQNWLYFNINEITSVKDMKTYLQSNPITIRYQLATESVKTVDLSTVNQDGNDTKLSTFNDITHVTLSSEGLIPEAELEVATKNEEVLNTMGLEMDDISTTQNALQETSNAQSENVDSTMIATTEIYEGLL